MNFRRSVRLSVLILCTVTLLFVLARASGGILDSLDHAVRHSVSREDPAINSEKSRMPTDARGLDDDLKDEDSVGNDQSIWSPVEDEPEAPVTPSPATTFGPVNGERASPEKDSEAKENQGRDSQSIDDARQIFSPLSEEGSRVSNDGFFNGLRVQNGGGAIVPPADPTPVAEVGLPWMEGQARGYTMLYAMQPDAREVVERNVQAMLTAHVKDLYIGVLIDGTFGQDFEYLRSLITRLSAEQRRLTVALYLSNGPTMRKWDTTPIQALFSRINPEEFRVRILREQGLQGQFREIARQAQKVFTFNTGSFPLNSNVALVMLEDNLDQRSYRVMRDLTREELGNLAQLVRNPCLGCFKGNDDDSLGDPREEHTVARFSILRAGDAFSLDGTGFVYPGATPTVQVSSNQLLSLMRESFSRALRYVGLWREEWQGVEYGQPNPHPELRAYIPSNDDQIGFEITALREGLNPVQDDEEEID